MRSSCSSLLLLALAACNQVFGLRDTRAFDAGQYDAPADAPYACPPLGGAPPAFSRLVHQALVQDCYAYSVSPAGLAIASCSFDGTRGVGLGPPDAPLTRVPEIVTTQALPIPRLSPDGQRILLSTGPLTYAVQVYEKAGSGAWEQRPDAPFGGNVQALGTLARGPTGDRVIALQSGVLHEWANEPGGWRDVMVQDGLALAASVQQVMMLSDGLRALVIAADGGLYYTDRPDAASKFRAAAPITGGLVGQDAFLADDCERLYASALGSVFYAPQQ